MTKLKYYSRLRSIYIIVIIFFVSIIAISYYFFNLRLIDYKTEASQKNATEQIVNNFDSKLALGTGMYNQLMTSQSIIEFLKSPDINYRNLISVMNDLKSLTGSFGDSSLSVAVGKPDCEIIVTPEYTKSLSMFLEDDVGIAENEGRQVLKSIGEKNFSYQTAVCSSKKGKKKITFVISSEIFQLNQQLVCYLILDIENILPEIDFEKNCISVFYMDKILYSRSHSEFDSTQAIKHISELTPAQNTFDYTKNTVADYNYHYMQSQRSDFMFYYITPAHQNNAEHTKILLYTLTLAVFLLAFGLYLAKKLTNRTYLPIKQLLSKVEVSDSLAQDEFSVIENILSSLNTENNRLNYSMERTQNLLRTNFFRSILQGFAFSNQEYEHLFSSGELDWMKRDISVVVYRLNDSPERTSVYGNAINIDANIANDFYDIINDTLKKNMQCELVKLNPSNTAIIFKADAEKQLIQFLNELLPYLEITFNISAVVAISQVTCDIKNIHVAFSAASSMLDNNITNVQHNILLRSEMSEEKQTDFHYPIELEANLIDHTFNTMRNGVEKVLEQILTENFDRRSLTSEQLLKLNFALSVTISRLLSQWSNKSDSQLIEETVAYEEIKHCKSRAELKSAMLKTLNCIMDNIDSQKRTQSTTFAADLMEYISANYQNDIALTDVSRRFNLSASYLSTLFKNSFGENFKDYLNIYRIKKAKEIISGNKYITVKELASLVGFNNTDTFIRVFKRYEGISPGQYINKNYRI